MSVQDAIGFIVRLGANEELKRQLVSCGEEPPALDSFVKLGGKIGLSFTIEELRAAHKHDWGMRDITSAERQPPLSGPDPRHSDGEGRPAAAGGGGVRVANDELGAL
ncbi:MAG: Nif11-like leader peptide family natural product precursor [Candidatus Thiosymbion ectosymbiont of Robbea hypermnestra]|nr:Nif11-like leader peptide family natural product precursor [Candidatus Thiosymbion ectosymbiont of Robbea hypermnestra]